MAYDVYLEILDRVDQSVKKALQRDSPDWRMQHTCPLCLYNLADEPDLGADLLLTMDGNTSLKLLDESVLRGSAMPDPRTYRTDYWVSRDEVDVFKDEVKRLVDPDDKKDVDGETQLAGTQPAGTQLAGTQPAGMQPAGTQPAGTQPDVQMDTQPDTQETEADLAETQQLEDSAWIDDDEPHATEPAAHPDIEAETLISKCVKRWKNAAPEAKKKMFALFDASGIFVMLCRHGHVIKCCDMVRSGEL